MKVAIVENNIIKNIVIWPDNKPLFSNMKSLPSGKWIGDYYDDADTSLVLSSIQKQIAIQNEKISFYDSHALDQDFQVKLYARKVLLDEMKFEDVPNIFQTAGSHMLLTQPILDNP